MRFRRGMIGTGIVFAALIFIGATQVCAMEMDTDRRGGQNIRSIVMDTADPALCEKACNDEPICKSWTYVKPGSQGQKARCWLKKDVPNAIRDIKCISGVKGDAPSASGAAAAPVKKPYEYGIDRRGGQNIRSIVLDTADPALCEKACADEPACKSWTYVKPGSQGQKARCWIKSNIPGQMKADCCVSGVK